MLLVAAVELSCARYAVLKRWCRCTRMARWKTVLAVTV